jgi:predicted nuclease of predicted toxin-antitoxin system
MKFLIVEQDLRVSGTSQGIISRSFLAKLRIAYPDSVIDVVYLKQYDSEDRLDLLPVDSIDSFVLDLKIPFVTKWLNKVYWRLFHISLKQRYIHKVYGSCIAKIDYHKHDHIFIRSAGVDHETILGTKGLPILKKAIVNFHDPYPTFWYAGSKSMLTNLELFRLKEMFEVVIQAKTCMSSASLMAEDMEYLYGSRKKFYTLPHQYDESAFDLSDVSNILKKNKKIMISYHGAIQFGRDIEILLDAYQELVENNLLYKENTEFVLRLKGIDLVKLAQRYSKTPNIIILNTLNFSNSCNEQMNEADINIILENGPFYCNILVGKAPFLAAIKKPILSISPQRSEMRRIIKDNQYIASYCDKEEIKQKLENLIVNRMTSNELVYPFGDYFSDENFKGMLDKVLLNSTGKL